MSISKELAELREKRGSLQMLAGAQEIAVFSGALTSILCAGVWLGSFVPKLDAREVAQIGIGTTLTLIGGAWLGHNLTKKELNKNWERITAAKNSQTKQLKLNCNGCSCRSGSPYLKCAVHPIEQPENCPDRRDLSVSSNVVKFQDASGLKVVVQDCSEAEVEEIRAVVSRVFNS